MIGTEIPAIEINYHSASCHDDAGQLFWWNGDLYRGIREESSTFYKNLYDKGIVRKLIEKRFLVETDKTDFTLDGYPLVFRHRVVPFVSFVFEWCPEMLRDAAFLMLDLTIELNPYGLFIDDPEPFNVLFNGCNPILVDLCSIEPNDNFNFSKWKKYKEEFISSFFYPLQLLSIGKRNSIRKLLVDNCSGKNIDEEVADLIGYRYPKMILSVSRGNILRSMNAATRSLFEIMESTLINRKKNFVLYKLNKLREVMESIPLPSMQIKNLSFTPTSEWSQKSRSIEKILSEIHPSTVLMISGNDLACYSKLAVSCGSRVVSIDSDESNVARCYHEARKENLPILPLVMDIQDPTPGFCIGNNRNSPAFLRLQSDMVMALSKVHTLFFDQRLNFEQIVGIFASFSKRWVLAEFVSVDDEKVRDGISNWNPNLMYTLENFISELKKRFHEVTVIHDSTAPRVFLLCEKSMTMNVEIPTGRKISCGSGVE